MAGYEFSTIKFVPHLGRDEAVNIGVLLYDPSTKLLHRRITGNVEEVRRRAGAEPPPGLDAVPNREPARVDDGCLDAMAGCSSPSSIVVTRPRSLALPCGHADALEWVFRSQVGVPDAEPDPLAEADGLLAELAEDARLPRGCYARWHEFAGANVPIRFPHVFRDGGVPRAAVFPVPLARGDALAITEQRLYEIMSIREWTDHSVDFTMLAVGGGGRRDARVCTAMAEARGVAVARMDGIGGVIDGIRRQVSGAPAARESGRPGGPPPRPTAAPRERAPAAGATAATL